MKKFLVAFFLLPLFSQAQIIGSSSDSANAIVKSANQLIALNMQLVEDVYPGKKVFADSATQATFIFRIDDNNEIKALSFMAPNNIADNMMDTYLLPLAKQNADFKSQDMWARFNKLLLVSRPINSKTKSLSLEKDGAAH